jgi:hypothetical protein
MEVYMNHSSGLGRIRVLCLILALCGLYLWQFDGLLSGIILGTAVLGIIAVAILASNARQLDRLEAGIRFGVWSDWRP